MDLNIGTMSSSMTKTTGMGGGTFMGKTGDEWADIGLTVGGVALATAGVIGIGGLILDNFGGSGGSSSSSSEEKKSSTEVFYVLGENGTVMPVFKGTVPNIPQPVPAHVALQQVAAPASPQPAAPVAPQPVPAHVALQQVAAPASPQPAAPVAPKPTPAPQPTFVTEAALDKKIEEVKASVTEALKNVQEAATIRIDDSALEKIAEMVVAKQAAPAPEAK